MATRYICGRITPIRTENTSNVKETNQKTALQILKQLKEFSLCCLQYGRITPIRTECRTLVMMGQPLTYALF